MEAWHQYTLLHQHSLPQLSLPLQVMAFKVTLKMPDGEQTIECPGEGSSCSPGSSSEALCTLLSSSKRPGCGYSCCI